MTEDKVSIIVPIYNREKFIDKCIKSIINQTYKNIEIQKKFYI
ncbi:MAG: glycosyltransferase [Thomasclavelia ramosa]